MAATPSGVDRMGVPPLNIVGDAVTVGILASPAAVTGLAAELSTSMVGMVEIAIPPFS